MTLASLDELLGAALALPTRRVDLADIPQTPRPMLDTPLHADRDLPPFNRSAMDGWAFAHAHAVTTMPCVGRVDAGAHDAPHVPPATCVRIATGAAVPASCDTVVPIECAQHQGEQVIFHERPKAWTNVHRRGVDAAAGELLMPPGTRVGPAEIGLAAACGVTIPLPEARGTSTARVCTSGDEVVPVSCTPEPHAIRNSNAPMVRAILHEMGIPTTHAHMPDTLDATIDAIRPSADDALLVTTGGLSVGQRDHVPAALDALGVQWTLVGAAVKPGKPVRLGRLGDMAVICLPGNPVAALLMGTLLLHQIIAAMHGTPPLTWRSVPTAAPLALNPRRELVRVGRLVDGAVQVPTWQGSGDLAHTVGMEVLVRLPVGEGQLAVGTPVEVCPCA